MGIQFEDGSSSMKIESDRLIKLKPNVTGKSNQNESHWQIQTKRKSMANPNKTKAPG